MIEPKGIVVLPLVVGREIISRGGRTRIPEPMAMDELASVEQFEAQGRDGGGLTPTYELVGRAASRIAPPEAKIIDLGCGPGRHLSYFAQRRPDVQIEGLDLAPNMLKFAERTIAEEGLADRITLRVGDMTDFAADAGDDVDLITSIFALHHLPSKDHLAACLGEIAEVRARTGCGVLLFDLARLHHPASWRRFLGGAQPALLSTPELERDSIASEAAAWSFDELRDMLATAGLADLKHRRSFPFAGFQLHWSPPRPAGWRDGDANWQQLPMPLGTRTDVVPLKLMFRQV